MKNPVAIIEVGSFAARIRIVEFVGAKTTIVEELVYPLATGHDTFTLGKISAKTMRAICGVMKNFAQVAREYKVKTIRAVATSAVREAENKDLVTDRIRHESGIALETLDNIEEGRLICQLLLPFLHRHLNAARQHILFMELGGGGTVTLLLHHQQVVRADYRRLGAARFLWANPTVNAPTVTAAIHSAVNSALMRFAEFPVGEAVFLNAPLRKIIAAFPETQTLAQGFCLETTALLRHYETLRNLDPETIAAQFSLAYHEAEALAPALTMIEHICRSLKLSRFYVLGAASSKSAPKT